MLGQNRDHWQAGDPLGGHRDLGDILPSITIDKLVTLLQNKLPDGDFEKLTRKCMDLLPPSAVYAAPSDVIVDFHTIRDEEARKKMCIRLNDLRRERCIMLAPQKDRHFWANESWVIQPMSRLTKNHFWEVSRFLPLFTEDVSKWKATLNFLKGCPEKPDNLNKSKSTRHFAAEDSPPGDWGQGSTLPLKASPSPIGEGAPDHTGRGHTYGRSRSPHRRAHPTPR